MGTSHLHSGTRGLNLASLNRIKHIEMSVSKKRFFPAMLFGRTRGHRLWSHRGGTIAKNSVAIEKRFLCFPQHGSFVFRLCFDYVFCARDYGGIKFSTSNGAVRLAEHMCVAAERQRERWRPTWQGVRL